jgi:bacillithiol system protein YtxJ
VSTIVDLKEKSLPADCLVFKHSTTCPVSASAAQEVRSMQSTLPVMWINVREQRDISNWVAETYGVAHESPQLILIRAGKPAQVWSHGEVRAANVRT